MPAGRGEVMTPRPWPQRFKAPSTMAEEAWPPGPASFVYASPGPVKRFCLRRLPRNCASGMGKDVRFRPAEQVELCPARQKIKALMGDAEPVLALEVAVELLLERVQMQH